MVVVTVVQRWFFCDNVTQEKLLGEMLATGPEIMSEVTESSWLKTTRVAMVRFNCYASVERRNSTCIKYTVSQKISAPNSCR